MRHRLGVALLVPQPEADGIDVLRRALGDPDPGRIPPHITLVPPVNVHDRDVDAAEELVRSAAASSSPLRLRLGPATTFHPRTPVVYLPVEGDVLEVRRLRDHLDRGPLARSTRWPYVPHVTLAEVGDPDRITAAVVAIRDYVVEVEIDRVHLLHEHREDTGRRVWRPLGDRVVGGALTVGRGGLPLDIEFGTVPGPGAARFLTAEWDRFDREEFGGPLPAEARFSLTGRRDGRIVGVATGRTQGSRGHLSELMVAAPERGTGVGRHLLARAESLAAERGCHQLTVRTAAGSAAEHFYRRFGYEVVAQLAGWLADRDFVLLRRDL